MKTIILSISGMFLALSFLHWALLVPHCPLLGLALFYAFLAALGSLR